MRTFVIAISLMLCLSFVSQVGAYEIDMVNLALNAETTSSGEGWGYLAAWAVDGITTGGSFFHNDTDVGDTWLEVDLGQPRDFERIEVYNRNDGCCPERFDGAVTLALDANRNVVFTSPAVSGAAMLLVYDNDGAGFSQVQYIRVEHTDASLAVQEIMAIDSKTFKYLPGGSNIPLHVDAVATQSTEYGGYPASNGIDGNFSTFTHTDENTADNWWKLDLGDTFFIDRVVVYTRFGCCPERIVNAYVTVLDEEENILIETKILEMAWDGSISLQLPPDSFGRYVTVGFANAETNPEGLYQISVSEVEVYGGNVGHASNPSPVDGAAEVPVDQALTWNVGIDPNGVVEGTVGYSVYFSSDSEAVRLRDPSAKLGFIELGSESVSPAMVSDTTYYWAVDQMVPDDANSIWSPVWSFTTPLSLPIVSTHPGNATTIEGGYARFSVAADNPLETELTFAWYKVGAGEVLSTAETLEIIDATAADDGQYYCVVSNGYEVNTDEATLKIAQPVVDWKLNETSGKVAVDSSGNGIDGVLGSSFSDADWLIDGGRSGEAGDNALNFTVTGDPNTSVLALDVDLDALGVENIFSGDASWTLITWIKIAGDESPYIIGGFGQCDYDGLEDTTYNDRMMTYWTDNYWYMFMGVSYMWASLGADSGEWEMLATVYDADALLMQVYQNGQLLRSSSVDWPNGMILSDTTENSFKLNPVGVPWGTAPAKSLKGVVDDYSVWDGALGAVELNMLYQGYGCVEAVPGDTNGDCQVNVVDLAALVVEWLDCGIVPDCL